MPPSRVPQRSSLCPPRGGTGRAGWETVLPGAGCRRRRRGAAGSGSRRPCSAGLGRPRRETLSAPRCPEPAALAAAAPVRSLGRRITWPGPRRASPARVTLYLRAARLPRRSPGCTPGPRPSPWNPISEPRQLRLAFRTHWSPPPPPKEEAPGARPLASTLRPTLPVLGNFVCCPMILDACAEINKCTLANRFVPLIPEFFCSLHSYGTSRLDPVCALSHAFVTRSEQPRRRCHDHSRGGCARSPVPSRLLWEFREIMRLCPTSPLFSWGGSRSRNSSSNLLSSTLVLVIHAPKVLLKYETVFTCAPE